MKFQPDTPERVSISAYADDWIAVNGVAHHHHLLLDSQGRIETWQPERLDCLSEPECHRVLQSPCEMLLLGTGALHRTIVPQQWIWFFQRGIGVEAMTTTAACRTFNVLAGEGRNVVALLLLPQT